MVTMSDVARLAVVIVVLGVPVHAQQASPTAADKAAAQERAAREKAAEDKAAQDAITRAQDFAEAITRAQQRAVEDARRESEAAARAELEKINARIPLDVEVVISRYQGDKRVSSLPYALVVNAVQTTLDDAPVTSLRMGGQIPIPTMSVPMVDGKPSPNFGPVQYRDVGTSIDARARTLGDGRFEVRVSVDDSTVATPQPAGGAVAATGVGGTVLPVIRGFAASNTLILGDGQTRQLTAAADRITGEVVKVDVTLRVAK